MSLRVFSFISFLAVLGLATPTLATTWTVRKDGTGQFFTINEAKNAAAPDDIIEVGPGVYAEEVDMSIPLTLVSTHGSSETVLDGETVRRVLVFRSGANHLEGFTIRRGYHVSAGGGLRVQGPATLTVTSCRFEDNVSDFDASAAIARDAGTVVDFNDCDFVNNHSARHCAVLIALDGEANFTACRFTGNTGSTSSTIAKSTGAQATIVNCLFENNTAGTTVWMTDGASTLTNNTFYGNEGSTLYLYDENTTVERNIFGKSQGGYGVYYEYNVTGSRACNVYWDNSSGPVNDMLGGDELVADPVFCDAVNGDFTVSLQSPAAPANSPCGQLIGAYPTACDIPPPPPPPQPVVEPVIISINDVPDDQGGQVRIRWERSDYDAFDQPYVISGYAVYRLQNGTAAPLSMPSLSVERGERLPHIEGWDYIATVPARGDDVYQYVAPTLCDKPKTGDPCWSAFFISAVTPNPLVYFDSEPDSGYSVDNLPPGPPQVVVVQPSANGNEIVWEPSESPDVVLYQVYRAVNQVPEPTGEYLVHATSETGWVDPTPEQGAVYAVSAVDAGGNESEPATQQSTTGVGDRIPDRMFLAQNAPNPFNPTTTIEFGVAAGGGHVTMEIFDVAGRRIRSLLSEPRAAGVWRVTWDGVNDAGTRVSSGVYFYRLRVGSDEQTRRMTLLE